MENGGKVLIEFLNLPTVTNILSLQFSLLFGLYKVAEFEIKVISTF